MKKLIKTAITATIMILTLGTTVSAATPKIVVNNTPIESVEPVMGNGDYLVPLRKTLETMGYKVYWDNTNQVTYIFEMDKETADLPRNAYIIKENNKKVYKVDTLSYITVYDKLKAGKESGYEYKKISENSHELELTAQPERRNNQLYLPLTFLSEVLSEKAEFNLETAQVEIKTEEKTYNNTQWQDKVPVEEQITPDGITRVTGINKPNTIKYKDREWVFNPINLNQSLYKINVDVQRTMDNHQVAIYGDFISGQKRNQEITTHSSAKGFGIFNNAKIGETVIMTDKNGVSTRYRIDKIELVGKTTVDTYKNAPETKKYRNGNIGEDVIIIRTCSNTDNTKVYSLIARPINY